MEAVRPELYTSSPTIEAEATMIHEPPYVEAIRDRIACFEATGSVRAKDFHDAVMASMGEGLYSTDCRGHATYVNPAAERLLGWTSAELMGRNIHDLVHRGHSNGTLSLEECGCCQVLHRGRALRDHIDVFTRKDGSTFPVTCSCAPMRIGAKIAGLVVVFRDMTERRLAEETQLRLAAIVESSDDAIISKDLNGVVRSWNKGAERIFGYSAEEMIGQPITRILPSERLDEEAEILRRLRLGERMDHFDTVRRHKSGRTLQVSVTISPIRDSTGKIIGASKIARDITARKRTEELTRFLAAANAVLVGLTDQPEQRLRKIAELSVPAFADWCAVDLREADGSLRRLALVQHDPAKIKLAEKLRRRAPTRPSDDFGAAKVLREKKADWSPEIKNADLADVVRDPEHRRLLRELGLRSYICVPMHSRDSILGTLTFVTAESGRSYTVEDLGAAEDLASRVVIGLENARLLAALQETNRRKDEFLAMLAHELRNPLAPIRHAVDIMRVQGPAVGEYQWARDVIERQLEQMTRLIEDLLDVSRITRGKIELRRERVQLDSVVANALEASQPLVRSRRQELTLSLPAEPIYLDADPMRVAQVLSNLLNNAAKYTEEGGHIWLTGERVAEQVVVRVKDTGVGIPAEMLPRIFDLFTQVDHSLERSQGGLGIGLTLVQRLVALHGGTVQAFSEGPGKGSEFVVRLPAAAGNLTLPGAEIRPDDKIAAPTSFRILVVDDNNDAANGLAKLLRLSGHTVHTAYDGLAALGAAATFQPDVVILDIGLPKLNGYEVGQRIRRERGNQVILVAVTGWGQESDRRRSREAGFDHHVTKPVEFAALKKMLSALALPDKAQSCEGSSAGARHEKTRRH